MYLTLLSKCVFTKCTSIIPVLGGLRQENYPKSKASLLYIYSKFQDEWLGLYRKTMFQKQNKLNKKLVWYHTPILSATEK